MSSRKIMFSNNSVYHLYNKTIDHKNVFDTELTMNLFVQLLKYYQPKARLMRYSYYHKLTLSVRKQYWQEIIAKADSHIDLLAYVLMPNHFHLLVKQRHKDGVVRFISQVTNSFTKAYNTYCQRLGPLFLPRFKAKLIITQEQLLHVSRYIHLNPYSSGIIKSLEELKKYKYSSLPEYLNMAKNNKLCQTGMIMEIYKQNTDQYWSFLVANANYQKKLEIIKHFELF